jgi:hypothetical protein
MKDLFKFLPQIFQYLPQIIKYLKYIPILLVLAAISYVGYYLSENYHDPYKCYNGEIYERLSIDSNVYKFVGGYCVDGKT